MALNLIAIKNLCLSETPYRLQLKLHLMTSNQSVLCRLESRLYIYFSSTEKSITSWIILHNVKPFFVEGYNLIWHSRVRSAPKLIGNLDIETGKLSISFQPVYFIITRAYPVYGFFLFDSIYLMIEIQVLCQNVTFQWKNVTFKLTWNFIRSAFI